MGVLIKLLDWDGNEQWSTTVGQDAYSIDVDIDQLQHFVFESYRAEETAGGVGVAPLNYRVSVNQSVEEGGAGAAWGEVIVTLSHGGAALAWGILGSLIAGYIQSKSEE